MKCRILCPTLLIETGEGCRNELSSVILEFDSEKDVESNYALLRARIPVSLKGFGILQFEAEGPFVIQSEFPLSLKCVSEGIWELSGIF